jgi:4-amino-4-deoxy-L-arabinose transferase-like glycosyltransferase
LLTIFPSNWYLFAGRLPSVLAGGFSVIGIYCLTKLLFKSRKIATLSAIFYIINPFTLFYDRMALFDSLLSAMLVWCVYFAIKTSVSLKIKDALCWGIFLGLAFLTKPTAIIFLLLTPVCMLVFLGIKKIRRNLKRVFFLLFVAIGISQIINGVQRLSSAFPQSLIKNQQFQQPLGDLLADPFKLFMGNSHALFSWVISYYTLPIFILGICCMLFLLYREFKKGFLMLILWLLPILAFALVGREIFPRYILFTTPYFLIPIAYFVHTVFSYKKIYRTLLFAWLFVVFYPSFNFGYLVLINPPLAPLPDTDSHQYITDHPSGYGLAPVFAFLNKESENKKITVVTQGTFGLYPYAFNLEFWNNKNVNVLGRWPLDKIDLDMKMINKREEVFIVLKEYEKIPANLPLQLVLESTKPGGRYPILVTTLKNL